MQGNAETLKSRHVQPSYKLISTQRNEQPINLSEANSTATTEYLPSDRSLKPGIIYTPTLQELKSRLCDSNEPADAIVYDPLYFGIALIIYHSEVHSGILLIHGARKVFRGTFLDLRLLIFGPQNRTRRLGAVRVKGSLGTKSTSQNTY